MHEFSTALSIIETVLKSSRDSGAIRVLAVELEIGELTFLGTEQLQFWIEEGFKKTLAEGAELQIEVVKPLVQCTECGYRGKLKVENDPVFHLSLPVFACPSCGSVNIELKRGKECRIKKIQILKEENDS